MMKLLVFVILMFIAVACSSENILTKQERIVQNNADQEVSTILFDNNVTHLVSYKVFNDGSVVISFDESIKIPDTTKVVNELRANHFILGVRAEQQGSEICPLRQ